MKLKVVLDEGALMPTRAHQEDAGLDLYTPEDTFVPGCEVYNELIVDGPLHTEPRSRAGMAVVDTGVHIEIPEGYVGMIKSKSGINVRLNIITEGVIDSGYTGSIRVKLYNLGEDGHHFVAGDKVAQLVILPIETPDLIHVDELEDTDRGDNGFGSTGR